MKRVASTALLAVMMLGVIVAGAGCGGEDLSVGTSNIDMAKDEAVKAGILAIQTGIVASIGMSQSAPATVDAASLGSFVDPWPKNPWTNQLMKPGTEKGDFTYQNLGGLHYRLVGHLSDGEYEKP
jgi:hypothetical protein